MATHQFPEKRVVVVFQLGCRAMTSGVERRVTKRLTAHFDVRFAEAADAVRAFNAFSVNFSSTGLCIRSRKVHAVGDTLWLDDLTVRDVSGETERTLRVNEVLRQRGGNDDGIFLR